jgi:hypothetical protein
MRISTMVLVEPSMIKLDSTVSSIERTLFQILQYFLYIIYTIF